MWRRRPPQSGPTTDGVAQNAEQPRPVEPTLAEIVKGAETAATQPGKPPATTAVELAKTTATLTKPSEPAPTAPGKGGTTEASAPGAPAIPTPAVHEAASVATTPADIDRAHQRRTTCRCRCPSRRNFAAGPAAGRSRSSSAARNSKIFVRQNFTPLFDAPVNIDNPDQPLGTHVFTAHGLFAGPLDVPLDRRDASRRSAERGEQHWKYVKDARRQPRARARGRASRRAAQSAPPETPQEALARIDIPQDVIDQISAADRPRLLAGRVRSGPRRRDRQRHGFHRRHALSSAAA